MIVPAIALALALTVALGFWFMCWDLDVRTRFATETIRYRARLQARQPYPTQDDYLECVRAAMTLTCRRYEQRLAQFVSERVGQYSSAEAAGSEGAHVNASLSAATVEPGVTTKAPGSPLSLLAADRFVRDADRAHNMLESALAGSPGGMRVVT